MQTSRTELYSTFSCGCYENVFHSRICDNHKRSFDYYLRSQKGEQVCHVWQYYQRVASERPTIEVVN